jgi:hypothetical protein
VNEKFNEILSLLHKAAPNAGDQQQESGGRQEVEVQQDIERQTTEDQDDWGRIDIEPETLSEDSSDARSSARLSKAEVKLRRKRISVSA